MRCWSAVHNVLLGFSIYLYLLYSVDASLSVQATGALEGYLT